MSQPMFTFSPDGKSIYAFSPGSGLLKMLAVGLISVLVCLSLALIELGHLAMTFLNFLLTSNAPVLVRFVAFILAGLGVYVTLAYLQVRYAVASAQRKEADHVVS